MRRHGAASEAAWAFARLEDFWKAYCPLTPLGKDEALSRRVLSDKAGIEALLDRTEAVAAWLDSKESLGPDRDRLAWHLRRIPRLPVLARAEGQVLDILELFQVKKFLANYRALRALLPVRLVELFGLGNPFGVLGQALDAGGSDPETFFVSDSYGEGLPEIRAALREVDGAVEEERGARTREARDKFGLDFKGLDFILLPHAQVRPLLAEPGLFSVDPWDDESSSVRLRSTPSELDLLSRREGLLAEEAVREARVLASLSLLALAAGADLERAANALCDFDCARVRALVLLKGREGGGKWCRPKLGPFSEALSVKAGTFLPCQEDCGRLGLAYSPLELELALPGAVIFGSNMGGKTVALQSLLFFQILAQAGFHVPAAAYSSSVWPLLHYVGQGAGPEEASGGLSGFGSELRSYIEAESEAAEGAFLVFDEFARTTSSHEAEALLSAILADLARRPGLRFFFSTHFTSVARITNVRYLRVRGLDRVAARQAMDSEPGLGTGLGQRIRQINRLMAYGLVDEEEGRGGGSDALAIASLLGLSPDLVAAAEARYDDKNNDTLNDSARRNAGKMEKP